MTETYADKIAAMTDGDLVTEAANQIHADWYSVGSNPCVSAVYDEAERRHKPWLYAQAWNRACRREGRQPDEIDRKLATPEGYWNHYG